MMGTYEGIASVNDLACDPGRDWLARTNDWRFMLTNPPPEAQVKVAMDYTPADGCLISLQQDPTGHAEPALFLAHFGAMVAVNGPAVGNPPADFPSASLSEQALAQRLAANLAP
jgi:hypothetical protein